MSRLKIAPHHATKAGFRIRDLADYGIAKSQAHRLIRLGKLPGATKLGGIVIIPRESLIQYFETATPIEPKS